MSDSKALAVRTTAIVPTDITGFADLASRFAKSNMIPGDLRQKPDDVFVTLLAGHELGLSPMASLRSIHVVKGKPILSADTMVGLVLGRGAARYFRCVEETDTSVTYETHREGSPEPQRATWTIADAKRAGLTGGNWTSYPRAMLKARCKSVLARDVYPDVLAGCYEEGERDEVEREAAPVTRITPRPVRAPEPDPEADVVDAEYAEAPAAWPAFLLALEPILKDDTGGWDGAMATREIKAAIDSAATVADMDALMAPIVAAMDKASGDPIVAMVRAEARDAYKARKAALKGKAAA